MKLKNVVNTCSACPSQWEAQTESDNRPVYIRYRWGYLSISVGDLGGDIENAITGEEVYGNQLGDDFHGVISWGEVGTIVEALPEVGGLTKRAADAKTTRR